MNILAKPTWLKKPLPKSAKYLDNLRLIDKNGLNTVCSDANCPNIEECFEKNKATFMILGNNCTRNCKYCNVSKDNPQSVDIDEPQKIANVINLLKLKFVVITSVTRDDIPDYGAGHFLNTVKKIKEKSPSAKIELLIPDFNGNLKLVDKIINSDVDVINYNIETVKYLFPVVRPMGNYKKSIEILNYIKKKKPNQLAKSGIMVGLGETIEQIKECFIDLKQSNVDIITIGQYMQPSPAHYPVKKYYTPEEFFQIKNMAIKIGIKYVFSGPFVRSSYGAEEIFNNILNDKIDCNNTIHKNKDIKIIEKSIKRKITNGKFVEASIRYFYIKKNTIIEKIIISGDFFVSPENGIDMLENFLKNKQINKTLKNEIDSFLIENNINITGFSSGDLTNIIKEGII